MRRVSSNSVPVAELATWEKAEKLLPEYTEQQFADLGEFVNNGGQIPPVVIAEDKRIIDGYNRWRLAKRLNIDELECDTYSYQDEDEMELHAIVLNSKRRHLNKLQVARAAVRLSELLNLTDQTIETEEIQENVEETTAEESLNDSLLPPPEEISEAPETISESVPVVETPPSDFETEARKSENIREASKKLGIAQSVIKQVKKVDETQDNRLIHAMEEKRISIKKAAEIAELPEDERLEVLEKECDETEIERKKHTTAVLKTCVSFVKKIQSCRKHLRLDTLPADDVQEMTENLTLMIRETNELLHEIGNR